MASSPAELRASRTPAATPAVAFELHLVHDARHPDNTRRDSFGGIDGISTPHVTAEIGNASVPPDVHVTVKVDWIGIQSGIDAIRGRLVGPSLLRRFRCHVRATAKKG